MRRLSCWSLLLPIAVALSVRAAPAGPWQAEVLNGSALTAPASEPDSQEIIQRSVEANQANWKEAENYSFTERDAEIEGDSVQTVKT